MLPAGCSFGPGKYKKDGNSDRSSTTPGSLFRSAGAVIDFVAWDWNRARMPLDTYRKRIAERLLPR